MLRPTPHPGDRLEGVNYPPNLLFLGRGELVPVRDRWEYIEISYLPIAMQSLPDLFSAWCSYEYWVGVGQSRVAIARRDGTDVFNPIDARAIASEFLGSEVSVSLVMPGFGRFYWQGYWIVEVCPSPGEPTDACLC